MEPEDDAESVVVLLTLPRLEEDAELEVGGGALEKGVVYSVGKAFAEFERA